MEAALGDSNCLEDPSLVDSVTCPGDDPVCFVSIVDNAANFDGGNNGLRNGVKTIHRGCENRTMVDKIETELYQIRTIGCNSMEQSFENSVSPIKYLKLRDIFKMLKFSRKLVIFSNPKKSKKLSKI